MMALSSKIETINIPRINMEIRNTNIKKTNIKKAKAKKTVIKKISKSKPVVSKKVEHLSLASLKSEAAKRLKSKLGELVVKKYMAVTKREKARLQKEITIARRELKKYC